MGEPIYVRRFHRLMDAIDVLTAHPAGMSLDDLAERLDADVGELREEIRTFFTVDLGADQMLGGYFEPIIEFVPDPDITEEYADLESAAYVRLRVAGPSGVAMNPMPLSKLAELSQAGHHRSALEPVNTHLAEALEELDRSILRGVDVSQTPWLVKIARPLRQAIDEQRLVRIVYARTWKPGVVERVIAPYRITHTRRGWEVDAGVVVSDDVRIYLVSGIQSLEILDEPFDVPPDVDSRIEANRTVRQIRLVVPYGMAWAIEAYAESAQVVDEDEELMSVKAEILEPAATRVGLMMLSAGDPHDTFVVEPPELLDAAMDLARDLLDHHSQPAGPAG